MEVFDVKEEISEKTGFRNNGRGGCPKKSVEPVS